MESTTSQINKLDQGNSKKIQESAKDFIEISEHDIVTIGHKKSEQFIGKQGDDILQAMQDLMF